MKLSVFFTLTAIISFIFGCIFMFAPVMIVEYLGLTSNPLIAHLVRILGGLVFSLGILNFLIRNESNAVTLKVVILVNIISHTVSLGNDISGIYDGFLSFRKIIAGIAAHIFILFGSIFFLGKINFTSK